MHMSSFLFSLSIALNIPDNNSVVDTFCYTVVMMGYHLHNLYTVYYIKLHFSC